MYEKLSEEILQNFGGKENILSAFHCITRLRLIPKDKSRVNIDALSKLDGILRVMDSQGQIQLVIGTHVNDVYDEFCEYAHLEKQEAIDVNEDAESNEPPTLKERLKPGKLMNSLLDTIAACVTPALWAIVAGGMIKGVSSTLTAFNLLGAKDSIITVLNVLGDAPFYFMPFLIGWASAKRFKINESFGLMIAGMLMYPTILSPAKDVTSLHFIFFDIPLTSYKGQIFPILLSVWVFSLVYKPINKVIHQNLRIVFSAALAFLIGGPLILGFVAPISYYATTAVINGVQWLFSVSGPLAGAIFAGIVPLTIVFGIKGFSVIELQNLETLGYDYMLPMFFYANCAVAGACIAASFKFHGNKRSGAFSTGLLGILGVTEPALYGFAIPAKFPLYAALAGSAAGGCLAMILNVRTYAFSMPGITSIATYLDGTSNIFMLAIVCLVSFGAAFALSYLLTPKDTPESASETPEIAAQFIK